MKSLYMFLAIPIVFFGCSSNQDVVIPDANLAAAVREALNLAPSDPIPQKRLEALEKLFVSRKGIKDLTGLEKAARLSWLRLSGNQIEDITPLQELTQLTRLWLDENRISDITPLANLRQLIVLSNISVYKLISNVTLYVIGVSAVNMLLISRNWLYMYYFVAN